MSDFETKLERLEAIAERLRDGDVRIDEAAGLFEEGVKLSRTLDSELRRFERRVEILASETDGSGEDDDGEPELDLFPDAGAPDQT